MKIARIAMALVATALVAAPIAAEANTHATRVTAYRTTTLVKKTNKATETLPLIAIAVAVPVVIAVKASKSNGI